MKSEEFWREATRWGHRLNTDPRRMCLFGFDERGEVRDEQHRRAVMHLLNTSGRKVAMRADAGQDYLGSPDQKTIDAMIAYVRSAPVRQDMARATDRK